MNYREKPIIAVGSVKNMFLGHFEFKDDLPKSQLKATVVRIGKGPVSLLLHAPVGNDSHELAGVLHYMEENNLDSIRVNGGTSLVIDFDKKQMTVRDPFEILGPACKKELLQLLEDNFPEFEIQIIQKIGQSLKNGDQSRIKLDGMDYTKDEIISLIEFRTKLTS